jgi:Uma2 family endonuclease
MTEVAELALVLGERASEFPQRFRWTREAYMQFGSVDMFGFRRRPQLIRGELWELGPISPLHAVGVTLIDRQLFPLFERRLLLTCQCPLDLGPETMPLPDLAILDLDRTTYGERHPTGHESVLVVEVADNTQAFDLGVKAELYAVAGVPEYWILDLNARVLHVLRDSGPLAANGTAYRAHRQLRPDDTVSPLAAPDRVVKVADLLP